MNEDQAENRLDQLLSKYKLPLAAGVVGLVLLIGGLIASGIIFKTFVKSTKYPKESLVQTGQGMVVKVDVSGAVANPGVYSLKIDSRIEEAIKAAGGIASEADPQYLSKYLNLAQKVTDGMKIYVPFEGEPLSGAGQTSGGVSGTSVINLNAATLAELDKLPGIGPVSAQKIIDSRPYNSIEELFTKKIVSKAVYEKVKEKVSVY